ncbi:alpha/beta fold hydrolase [Bacillus horti]|uniref:Pimeloyl-ACP methyl ester carboxylesterase n=1 Tax=Caldalkalibacillus horti TaxID=77523 RepID=A0ABT9VZP8_9BACI|nr:alpha/beta hydrolase [Bacillus horti]MDQ0166452.1 pimeloyl-ACP methyl ester carboxylesterase [Bacillus horti]
MPEAKVNGTTIYYESVGKGTPLFLIPGLGGVAGMYKPQKEFFKLLYHVIIPELRGNGRSGELQGSPKEVMDTQCQDIKELMDELEIEEAILVGVSYGGVFCQRFATLFPQKVKGLVIVDSFCDTRVKTIGLAHLVAAYLAVPMYYLPTAWLAKMTELTYKKWPVAAEEMRKTMEHIRKKEVVKQRLYINKLNYTEYLPNVHCPTLLISGKQMPGSWMEQLKKLLPRATLIYLEDSFDPSNLCQPDLFNQRVYDFLDSLPG